MYITRKKVKSDIWLYIIFCRKLVWYCLCIPVGAARFCNKGKYWFFRNFMIRSSISFYILVYHIVARRALDMVPIWSIYIELTHIPYFIQTCNSFDTKEDNYRQPQIVINTSPTLHVISIPYTVPTSRTHINLYCIMHLQEHCENVLLEIG